MEDVEPKVAGAMDGGGEREADAHQELALLESRIGYSFEHIELLQLALTHRSRSHERGDGLNYERLEFLGDSVLGLVVADQLFRKYPGHAEGELSQRKGLIVSAVYLSKLARRLEIGEHVLLGVGEDRSGGRTKGSILADVVEAIIGAIYVDSGHDLEPVRRLVDLLLDDESKHDTFIDSKSRLQEISQAAGWGLPEYRLIEVSGADHEKEFVIECRLGPVVSEGQGGSKKEASQRAARSALEALEGPIEPA